ncbi:MAG: type I-C CRISPR-associated protein Cas8c/Csd1 [Stellaceae bacterium]
MTVLQALDRYYDRLANRREVVSPGYSVDPIGFVITIAPDGAIMDVALWRDASGKKPRAERVPKWFGRSGNGSTPYFLWDNTAYALGVSSKDPAKTARDHAAFLSFHLGLLRQETDAGLVAFRCFLETWTPDQFLPPHFDQSMLAWNVAFRLDGEQRFIHERPAAGALIEQLRTGPQRSGAARRASNRPDKTNVSFCLVTGRRLPIARLHTKIKGVDGTASAEVPLVSFNEAAFESYGQEQGSNAPTSEAAVFRYTAALNCLLDRASSRNRLKIADATVVFWADTSEAVNETAAAAAEDAFASMFNPGAIAVAADDASEAAKLRDALDKLAKGRPVQDLDPQLVPGTRFHVLGLAPNIARLSVRYWLDDDFEAFVRRLGDHYRDLFIEPAPWRAKPPSVQRLLVRTTALQEKFENIPRLLAGEMMRAVLGGTRYPRTLLSAAIIRLRAGDDPGTGWHAAALRAVLARDHRLAHQHEFDFDPTKEPPMSLDRNHPNMGYQAGRLFAVYELAQRAALGRDVRSTIRDKYFGAASATPASIFPLIITNGQNHLSKIRKEKPGWAAVIEKELEEVMGRIKPTMPFSLPRSLRLEDQGEFAIGYYHQRRAKLGEGTADQPTFDDEAQEGNDPDE